MRRYEAGQVFCMPRGADTEVYFALKGSFRISKMTADGRYVTIRSAALGDQFGDIAAFGATVEPAQIYFVQCIKPGICFVMPGDAFCKLVTAHPVLTGVVLREVAAEAMRRADRIYELAMLDVRSRLLAELVRVAERRNIHGDLIRVEPAPTHDALAAIICASREGVTRHMQDFVRCGLLRVPRRGSLEIVSFSALTAALEKETGARNLGELACATR
jgi:CRP-like cAMP-binding protein